ncbi:MAG TPA: cyclic nucleotide-binding domain-containing protein [Myxococcales bacterium]|nr:cyclic nucleotide-binding domain-containing protein [Myxococcales bacterium]
MRTSSAIARAQSFLGVLPPEAREELLRDGARRRYAPGQLILCELEPGDELLLLLSGRAAVSVGRGSLAGEERLSEVGAGEELGEVALLTGALRSATVTALEPTEALALPRDRVRALMTRHPAAARHFARLLAGRLASADDALARALDPARAGLPLAGLPEAERRAAAHPRSLASLVRAAFRELVVEHRRELPFFVLAGFLAAVTAARLGIWALHAAGLPLLPLLRLFYVGGVFLLIGTGAAAPFAYRRELRRALCVCFGAGAGLLANELSVLIAFDIFYRDIFDRDPTLAFDPAALYHRSESLWAFAFLLVAFAQATYFSDLYRRVYYLVRERLSSGRRRP